MSLAPQTALLDADALTYSYGSTPALRGIDISVDHGEMVAVTGPSGCGKSTLLHCLSGILQPDAGRVMFDGVRLDTAGDAERSRLRRSDIGIVFQFGQLVRELTAQENVALPLLLAGHRRTEALAAAGQMLERLEVAELATSAVGALSGGQTQRVALGRAMVTEPRLLFADEPTGALDSFGAEQVMTQLSALAHERGTAVVLVTHDARIAAYADRELAMVDGRDERTLTAPSAGRTA